MKNAGFYSGDSYSPSTDVGTRTNELFESYFKKSGTWRAVAGMHPV